MDSEKKTLMGDITLVVNRLSLRIESLQKKIEELCKSTGDCAHIRRAHQELLPPKKENNTNGIDINTLREKE